MKTMSATMARTIRIVVTLTVSTRPPIYRGFARGE